MGLGGPRLPVWASEQMLRKAVVLGASMIKNRCFRDPLKGSL